MISKFVIVVVVMGQALAPLLAHSGIQSLAPYVFYVAICICLCFVIFYYSRLGQYGALILIGLQSVIISTKTFSWCLLSGYAIGVGFSHGGGSWLLANLMSFYTSGFIFSLSIGTGSVGLTKEYKLVDGSFTVLANVTSIIAFFVIVAAIKSGSVKPKPDSSVAA